MKISDLLVASVFGACLSFGISNAQGNTNTFERWENARIPAAFFADPQIQLEGNDIIDGERSLQTIWRQVENADRSRTLLEDMTAMLFYNARPSARLFPNMSSRRLYAILYGSAFFDDISAPQRLSTESHILKFYNKDLNALQRKHVDFSKLREMQLQNNGIESLNWLPRSLHKLRVFILSNNRIKSLNFPDMKHLTCLRLNGNPLTEEVIMSAPWGNMPNLKMLDLPNLIKKKHRNKIEEIIRHSCPNVSIYWKGSK